MAIPLNSRRLNASHLQLVTQALDLPTDLCSDELRQLIDGKLTDMEHEPMNVQVVLQERTRTELLVLLVDGDWYLPEVWTLAARCSRTGGGARRG